MGLYCVLMGIYLPVRTHICQNVGLCACVSLWFYINVCVCKYVCVGVRLYGQMYVRLHACMFVYFFLHSLTFSITYSLPLFSVLCILQNFAAIKLLLAKASPSLMDATIVYRWILCCGFFCCLALSCYVPSFPSYLGSAWHESSCLFISCLLSLIRLMLCHVMPCYVMTFLKSFSYPIPMSFLYTSHFSIFYFLLSFLPLRSTSRFCTAARAKEIEEFFEKNPLPSSQRRISQSVEAMRVVCVYIYVCVCVSFC